MQSGRHAITRHLEGALLVVAPVMVTEEDVEVVGAADAGVDDAFGSFFSFLIVIVPYAIQCTSRSG